MIETMTHEELHRRYLSALEENDPNASEEALSKASKQLVGMSRYCGCSFTSASALLYLKVTVVPDKGGKQFSGDAWGVSGFGANTGWGDLYTDDYNALVNHTASFMFTLGAVYSAVYFYDGNSHLLGTAQFGGIGSGAGVGGGQGRWA
jgi:hypothetical protein